MNRTTLKVILGVFATILLIGGIVALIFYWPFGNKIDQEFNQDTTVASLTVPVNKTIMVSNGATLTVKGDADVAGMIFCDNGPLNLVVEGNLNVSGSVVCDRGEEIPNGDPGSALNLVLKGEVKFEENAEVVTNGHVQIVDEESLLAKTTNEISQAFDDVSLDNGGEDGFRIGPFIPIEVVDGEVFIPKPVDSGDEIAVLEGDDSSFGMFEKAHAQEPQPAVDAFGDLVPGWEFKGRWYLGDPNADPPPVVSIPTPPKKIKKIYFFFKTASNRHMILQDMTVFAPDGSPGDDKEGGCDLTGDTGSNALRMKAEMYRITVNNVNLYLGDGGWGGNATTDEDCRDGTATGGAGGEAGDLKLIAGDRLEISGALRIFPGEGGAGGTATAYGDDGEAGSPGEDGGNAIATGGAGGDNKKGLKIFGNVVGVGNIELHSLTGGKGGEANAFGGNGGNGEECGDNGGKGGDVTATGGAGGNATSKSVESFGGDGGGASAFPGNGGSGGSCGSEDEGGWGGNGGDAFAFGGVAGTGQTANGDDGTIFDEAGGDGGTGGDGCLEGLGGLGGFGNQLGEDGEDGDNLCIGDIQPPRFTIGFDPELINEKHTIGETNCPQFLGEVTLNLPEGWSWEIPNKPGWLNIPTSGGPDTIVEPLPINFNCNISDYSIHTEMVALDLVGTSPLGEVTVAPGALNVNLDVK